MSKLDQLIVDEVSHSHRLRPIGVDALTLALLNKVDVRQKLFPDLPGEVRVDRGVEVPENSIEEVRQVIKRAIEEGWKFERGDLKI